MAETPPRGPQPGFQHNLVRDFNSVWYKLSDESWEILDKNLTGRIPVTLPPDKVVERVIEARRQGLKVWIRKGPAFAEELKEIYNGDVQNPMFRGKDGGYLYYSEIKELEEDNGGWWSGLFVEVPKAPEYSEYSPPYTPPGTPSEGPFADFTLTRFP